MVNKEKKIRKKGRKLRERNEQRHIKQGQRLIHRGDTHKGIKEYPHPQGHNLYSKIVFTTATCSRLQRQGSFPLQLILGQVPQTSQTWSVQSSLCLKVCSLFVPWAKATLQDNIFESRFYKENEVKSGQVYIPRGERAWKGCESMQANAPIQPKLIGHTRTFFLQPGSITKWKPENAEGGVERQSPSVHLGRFIYSSLLCMQKENQSHHLQ